MQYLQPTQEDEASHNVDESEGNGGGNGPRKISRKRRIEFPDRRENQWIQDGVFGGWREAAAEALSFLADDILNLLEIQVKTTSMSANANQTRQPRFIGPPEAAVKTACAPTG